MRLRWDGIIARLSYRFNFLAIRAVGDTVGRCAAATGADRPAQRVRSKGHGPRRFQNPRSCIGFRHMSTVVTRRRDRRAPNGLWEQTMHALRAWRSDVRSGTIRVVLTVRRGLKVEDRLLVMNPRANLDTRLAISSHLLAFCSASVLALALDSMYERCQFSGQ